MQTVEILSPPGLDVQYYLDNIINFISNSFPKFIFGFENIIGYLIGLSIIVSIFLLIVIIYSVEKLKEIRNKESEIYDKKIEMAYEEVEKGDPEMANKWNKIKVFIEAENENDWRQAIIHADIMLGDLLTKCGYKGEGIGEQLKRVEKSDFETLDQAWEAHKARNAVAHEGADYVLSKNEARRIISLYRRVFEEFFII